MIELIKQLAEMDAPSGGEAELADVIASQARPYADEIKRDRMGNLLVRKKGPGAGLLLACRMDEPGFSVTHVDGNGFLRFGPLGDIPPIHALGARVRVSSGALAVICEEKHDPKAEHVYDRMFLDLGAKDGEEAGRLAKVGDLACFASEFQEREGLFMGKALSSRAPCAALLQIIKTLPTTANDILFAFTVQGELAGRGAGVVSYDLHTDLAIVLDACEADDIPGTKGPSLWLGRGPAIRVKDSQMVTSSRVREFLMSLAALEKVPYQLEVSEAPALDARTIQNSSGGTPTGVLSLPVRYRRTPNEFVALQDWKHLVKLLAALAANDFKGRGF